MFNRRKREPTNADRSKKTDEISVAICRRLFGQCELALKKQQTEIFYI